MLAREAETPLKTTPLHALHVARGGKMVPFAGYDMPVQFAAGVLREHLHTRFAPACSTSRIWARSRCARNPARSRMPHWRWSGWCRRISLAVAPGRQRYAQFTNEAGGILDDLMVANFGDHLFLVVNAACKAEDEAHLRAHLVRRLHHRAAGRSRADRAAGAEGRIGAGETLCPDVAAMRFMDSGPRRVDGIDCFVSRSGYTGEDGFEISVPADHAEALGEDAAGKQRRAADRARRARQPAAGGRALPLWP